MSTEGVLWFTDLTLSDPFFILPVVLTTSNIINIEVRRHSHHLQLCTILQMHSMMKGDPSTMQRVMTTLFRTLSVAMGVVSSQLPAVSLFPVSCATIV